MTIDAILSKMKNEKQIILNSVSHPSLKKCVDPIFYIEPEYKEISRREDARIIIFSAPGASGKTTLAKAIAHKYKLLLWDLSKIQLGENSFSGTMLEAMTAEQFFEFRNCFSTGNMTIVIDAFDEAKLISGIGAVNFLLSDIVKYSDKAKTPVAILFSRTETSKEIVKFLNEKEIAYSHYEIGFIKEYNAKIFIREAVKNKRRYKNMPKIRNDEILDKCINEQFILINQILDNDEERKSFLGYPPVLEALSTAYDEQNNLIKLLNSFKKEADRNGTKLIFHILKDLLIREQEKVVSALKEKWKEKYSDFNHWNELYTIQEQLVRITEYIVLGEIDTFYIEKIIDGDIYSDYLDTIKLFVPEHPFIQNTYENKYNFTGPAFRDYAISYLISDDEYKMLAEEYLNNENDIFVTSQLLFDLYTFFSNEQLPGEFFPLIYDSYKARENCDINTSVQVFYDGEFINAAFSVGNIDINDEDIIINIDKNQPVVINHLERTKIDIPFEIRIGANVSSVNIIDASIICKKIVIDCKEVYIRSTKENSCVIISEEPMVTAGSQFFVNEEKESGIKINLPNISSYYALRPYDYAYEQGNTDDLLKFAMVVDKILDCMRKHGKDTPAKDKEYIDNIVVAGSDFKKSVLKCLLDTKIIYIDNNESHLYKMDASQLKEYGLGWQSFVRQGTKPFELLHKKYTEHQE